MYRLASMWVITIIIFRWFNNIMSLFFGPEWGVALHVPLAFLWTVPLEIFLRRSGRFDWSKEGRIVAAREVSQLQCPFLGASAGAPGGSCPFHTEEDSM